MFSVHGKRDSRGRGAEIHIAGVDDRECGEEKADQRLVGVLQKLKGICKLRDLRRLSLSVADLMTGSRLRKLIEYVYQDEEADIEVYTGARKRVDLVQEQETVGVEEWRTVSRSREKIVVKKVGNEKQMTYADLLKKMQTTIKVRDLGIKIKNIREAKNGNIEITAAGKNEGKEAFIKLIEEKMQGTVEAQKFKPKRKIFTKDLHETTTGEEVRETLSKLFGKKRVDANDISVSMATKPNKGGKLFAIVNLPIDAANILMKMAKLTVGWSECRIEDMNTPRRCYRCLRFGHVRAECKSEKSLEDCCLKCGRAGHTARLCTDEPYCIACDVEGHRADEMACPEYKKVGDVRAIESGRGRGRGRGAYAQTRLSLPKNEEVAGISGARQKEVRKERDQNRVASEGEDSRLSVSEAEVGTARNRTRTVQVEGEAEKPSPSQ
jgi:acylphosphatase